MKKIFSLLYFLISFAIISHAQLSGQDLSRVRIDEISDSDLKAYYEKAKASNLSDNAIIDNLLQRGLPASEIDILRSRLSKLANSGSGNSDKGANSNSTPRKTIFNDYPIVKNELDSLERQIYGMDIFTTSSSSFDPNLRLATPSDYVLGPDDELIINVYGYSERTDKLIVNPDGNIVIPNVGPVYVNGLTIDEAKTRIVKRLASTIYPAINSGRTHVQLTLGNIKTIRVVVIGQAKRPGTYNISSLSTLFNLLYLCGGPNKNGSFRQIELIRGGKKIQELDLYRYLQSGEINNNLSLKDNDVINIPYYKTRIKLNGEVKRPGFFEVSNENLLKVMSYAGGFTDSAYRSQVRVFQLGERERKIIVLQRKDIETYIPETGDEVVIEKILNRFANRVIISGAVYRPGAFDLTEGSTLKQLIERADGIKEDAFLERGNISRLQSDQTRQLIAFNALDILKGTAPDIPLMREDSISIPSIFDLRDSLFLTIEGEVRRPGRILYKQGMSIKDAILASGGFTEAASAKRIEIGRRILNPASANSSSIAEVINVDTEKELNTKGAVFLMKPFDIVVIRNTPGYVAQKSVTVQGEIQFTGKYVLAEKNEHLSDVIIRAGGLTSFANPNGASLKRLSQDSWTDTLAKNNALIKLGVGTGNVDSLQKIKAGNTIGINLDEVLKFPHSSADIILEDGDIINVPKKDAVVKVNGEVLFPAQLSYIPNESLKFYISRAGGFTDKAQKSRTFIVSANGNAKRTHSFWFFRKYPKVEAGDEIYIPRKADKKGLSTAEIIGLSSGIASLAGVVIAILNLTK